MDYISTRGQSPAVDSAQAVLSGLAPDGGLYMPGAIPAFDWQHCLALSAQQMSAAILSALLPDIPNMDALVKRAYTGKFETEDLTPTVPVGDFQGIVGAGSVGVPADMNQLLRFKPPQVGQNIHLAGGGDLAF